MIYLSIDLETTGLDHENNQILTFSGVLEDTTTMLPFEECPKINLYLVSNQYTGSPVALGMNSAILNRIGEWLKGDEIKREVIEAHVEGNFIPHHFLKYYLYVWCLCYYSKKIDEETFRSFSFDNNDNGNTIKAIKKLQNKYGSITINAAGKNFSTFDKRFLDKVEGLRDFVNIRQRILDPGILYLDWEKDESIPSLDECKVRAGIEGVVTHESLYDAWDVVQLLRKKYNTVY